MKRSNRFHPGPLAALLLLTAAGASAESSPGDQPPPLLEEMWSATEIYQDDDDQGIETFRLVGRYHGQYWSVDADQGRASGGENRRVIFGFQALLHPGFLLELQMHVNDEFNPVYDGLYTGFIKWTSPTSDFSLSLGRLDYLFTGMERSTSSKKNYTFERGLLVNQIMPGEVVGLYGRGKIAGMSLQAGLFSGNIENEFTDFSAGLAATAGVAYDLPWLYEKGTLHLDYLYNDGNRDNNAFEPYGHTVSLWHQGRKGPFALGIDLTGATGIGERSNVWGLTLLPTYDFARNLVIDGDMLQLSLRYQYASSVDDNGLRLQRRYEQNVASGQGDEYHAVYAGLNYYIYGYKLKLMMGSEYSRMRDTAAGRNEFRGWTHFAGIRLYF